MSLNEKLVTVGLFLIVAGPIIGLILWRMWRGELRFYGFWVTPREFKENREKEKQGEWPPPGA